MSSPTQILADRQSSLLGAGDPVLPHEDRTQFNALLERYKLDFSPSNGHEEFLVVIMVGARWRLERAGRIETAILGEMLDSPETSIAQTIMNKDGDALFRLERYRAGIERTYLRCTRELHASKKFNIDVYTTQLAEKKFENLLTNYINAPFRSPQKPPVQNEANSSPAPRRKIGRNEICPCGSGLKFKKCCLDVKPVVLQSAA